MEEESNEVILSPEMIKCDIECYTFCQHTVCHYQL